ncbi:hypothetical protein EFW17_20070 [Halostreptopolyspora alba]|uniref:Uncharacterized protein n=1 Tax=Halostreptopolyspora alba TaxID=2487137 RepID=A0A3N0E2Z6_9ACTN|nr:hypothetical protein EFW17_20070 [Nocardiopsaceae bacterium YIM 96095]
MRISDSHVYGPASMVGMSVASLHICHEEEILGVLAGLFAVRCRANLFPMGVRYLSGCGVRLPKRVVHGPSRE